MNRFRCVCSVAIASALCFSCICLAAAAETGQQVKDDGQSVSIGSDGRTVLEYRYAKVPFKPYVKQLSTPGGVQVLRDAPHDHLHHHALMFAIAADGVDFWSETPGCGRQVSQVIENTRTDATDGRSTAAFSERLDWVGPGDAKRLQERRTLRLHAGPALKATLLTWQSHLETPAGKPSVKLTGSHYFGLGMRFVKSMDKEGRFFNSEKGDGQLVRGSERVTPAKWCAYVSKVDDRPVTVAMFDHPKNARPAHFFTMRPFAYLSATINLWKEPVELKAGAPFDLRYGVALWDAEIDAAQVAEVYKAWCDAEK